MRFLRLTLILGGLFNVMMGIIFLSTRLLKAFFSSAEQMEKVLFNSDIVLNFPADPLHLLLIHGFGAGVVILGVTLLYAVRNPRPLIPFIVIDGIGRLVFSGILFYYIWEFSLLKTLLLFGSLELALAIAYIWGGLQSKKWTLERTE